MVLAADRYAGDVTLTVPAADLDDGRVRPEPPAVVRLVDIAEENDQVVGRFHPVEVDIDENATAGAEQVELLDELRSVRAEIDVFATRDQPLNDLVDLRMQQGLAAGEGHADHAGAGGEIREGESRLHSPGAFRQARQSVLMRLPSRR